jgi:phage baseplate assembly protein gpV
MINHEYLELFNEGSVRKDIDIVYDTDQHISNSDVVSGTFSLNESAFATKELRFGSLVASELSVKLYNTVPNLMDKEISVSITLDNMASNPLKIGKYKVLEDKPTTDRLYKQIKAYDSLYEVINKEVVSWYEGLLFPMTLKVFRDSFFVFLGIEQENTTLINDDMLVDKTILANSIPGKQVLSAICELNGAIGRMNRDGKFEYVILDANPTSRITIDNIASKSGSYEDFDCRPISKVQIRQTTDDIGAIVGEDGNTYIMQDNFLVYGKSASDLNTIATNLLSVIKGISYKPFNIKAIYGNPCYEIGDAITVVTANKTFNSYMFNRTLKGIQAMTDNIKADGVEYYTENINSANTQIQQLARQTNELSRTVEETKSTITSIEVVAEEANQNAQEALNNVGEAYDKATEALDTVGGFDERISKNESSITQNAKEIELKVSVGDVSSQLSVESDQVTISGNRLVVDADNLSITKEGKLTANEAVINGNITSKGQIVLVQDDIDYTTTLKTALTDITYASLSWNNGIQGASSALKGQPVFVLQNSNGIKIDGYALLKDANITTLYSNKLQGFNVYANSLYSGAINTTGITSTGLIQTNGAMTAVSGFAVGNASYRTAIRHISCGSAVLTPGSTTSTGVKLLAHSTVKGWYSGATASNTAILVTNGDGASNGVHIEGVTYNNSDASWYVVCDTAPGKVFRVNYVVICW